MHDAMILTSMSHDLACIANLQDAGSEDCKDASRELDGRHTSSQPLPDSLWLQYAMCICMSCPCAKVA